MSKLTKNKKLALEKIDGGKVYTIDEAAKLVKEITFTKFDRYGLGNIHCHCTALRVRHQSTRT